LLGVYVEGKERVDTSILLRAARETFGEIHAQRKQSKIIRWLSACFVLIACVVLLTSDYVSHRSRVAAIAAPEPMLQNHREPAAESQHMDALLRSLDQPGESGDERAYQMLFNQWHITYLTYRPQGGQTVCEQAQMQGLYCLHKKGDLGSLRSINRPAVVKLFDDQGKEFSATLIALQEQAAAFATGADTKVVDVKEVARWWSGDYVIFWRPPPKYQEDIKRGSRGPLVRWLDKQLSLVQGRTARSLKDPAYDDTMRKQLQEFQRAQGLAPDGRISPETIIRLSTAVGSDEPLLHDRKEAR
jgi:general secretion pathway protein A